MPRAYAPVIHHLPVRRTARYATLGGSDRARSVWYVLHGYRQLADRFIARFADIAAPDRLIVAPEGLNRFYLDDDDGLKPHGPDSPVGATWMTRHDRESEIDDYVAYLDRLDRTLALGRDVRRVVLGFSQGSATAARWSVLGRRRPRRVVLWGGLLPPDLDAESHARRLRSLAPVLVCGERDASLPPERVEAERARLASFGIDATTVRHAGGHAIDGATLARIAHAVDPRD